MSGRLAGKTALITGAAGGIGAASARLFAEEGAKVVTLDFTGKADIIADIADEEAAKRAVADAVGRLGGKLDILVNNAAQRAFEPVADSTNAAWRKAIEVNLIGSVNITRPALPHLRKSGKASVVIVSSAYALTGRAGWGQYDASKAALVALTRTLACEEAAHNIRVNAVCPGGTLPPFTLGRAKARGLSEEQLRATGGAPSLLKRWATPEEVAFPILWLASDEASYITGVALPVDAGLTAM